MNFPDTIDCKVGLDRQHQFTIRFRGEFPPLGQRVQVGYSPGQRRLTMDLVSTGGVAVTSNSQGAPGESNRVTTQVMSKTIPPFGATMMKAVRQLNGTYLISIPEETNPIRRVFGSKPQPKPKPKPIQTVELLPIGMREETGLVLASVAGREMSFDVPLGELFDIISDWKAQGYKAK